MHEALVAPSILSADFARLGEEIAEVAVVTPWVHVDVMDGHYVPNLTIGPPVVQQLRRATDRFLDTHLMITDPRTYGPQFVEAGSDSVTFHPEVDDDPVGVVKLLQAAGAGAGIAIRPHQALGDIRHLEDLLAAVDLVLVMTVEPGFGGQSFMPEVLPKIEEVASWRASHGASFRIEVDGGIKVGTAAQTASAGADTFVAGSAVFGQPDRAAALTAILEDARRGAGNG